MDVLLKIFELYRNETVIMLQINVITIFVTYLIYQYYQDRKNPLSRQILKRMRKGSEKKKFKISIDINNNYIQRIIGKINTKAEKRLKRSDLNFTVKEYTSFLIIGALVGFGIGFLIFPFSGFFKGLIFFINNPFLEFFIARIVAGALLGFIGSYTPVVLVIIKQKQRQKKLKDQMIDFILSLADGIKTARTPQEAIRVVAEEMPDPISQELRKTVQEIDFAIPYETALENLKDRINLEEYELVIIAMQIQNKTGGHLEQMLRNMASVAEERREIKDEVLKIVRETQNMTYILLASPFVMFAGLYFMMGEEFKQYIFSFIGIIFLAVLAVMFVIGTLLMYAISKNVKKVL